MHTKIHTIIRQLVEIAVEKLRRNNAVYVQDVVNLYRRRYLLGVNLAWTLEYIEFGNIVKIIDINGKKTLVRGKQWGESLPEVAE
jgi:hypothetical protein